ncbi:MAG TPA: Asp-tRNA(Asn)/Glu-tRNA(Gln) amidotransferase subunit GatA [Candidatus Binatia bacterium]|jgi:aspartyl-tRNA(Asn)/glutamyl-tRNA(Gln) amidotransferase subunit A|nr:Asp-tRNA(Asn)/Glu-tRNA(Gln) amidotransferase subunit GatA [Candidatus Binatia bacterium]
MALHSLTIHDATDLLRKRQLSAQELTRSVLERIRTTDTQTHSYLTVCETAALSQAEAADRTLAAGESIPLLCGIPVAVKDVILTRGIRSTAGSKILEHFVPPYDATVTRRLREAGAVISGKVNCDEFAMGSSTENSAFLPSRNPWDLARVPGGSSGGSATAVAADQALAALGTDTGGSIRLPSSFCGVVGLKPTYGRVSRFGVVAYASSLDQVGPFAKDVRDCALMLQAIAGHDPRDSTSVNTPVPDYQASLTQGVRGLKIGIPKEYFVEGMQPAVEAAVHQAVAEFAALGAQPVSISLPHTEYAIATYYIIATAEASSNLARYDGMKYGYRAPQTEGLVETYRRTRAQGFGDEVKRRIMLGTYVLSAGYYDAYYLKAQKVRTLIRQDFLKAFEDCDVIATPVAPTTAFRLGEKTADPLTMYLSDIFTIAVNLAGLPGLSVPCGFDENNMPIGVQLIGKPFGEDVLLQAAYAYEQTTQWHTRKPTL